MLQRLRHIRCAYGSLPVIAAASACLLLLVGGCGMFSGISDFMHVRYQNVVGYFNTYYNATRAFDDALEETEQPQQRQQRESQQELLSLKTYRQSLITSVVPGSKQKFDVVIEKCSRLLQYYPDSKWVDDALLLIGKSYYCQTEYLRAQRKFLELISKYPNSSLYLEAKLWLGKSLLKSRNQEEAFASLNEVIKQGMDSGEEDLVAKAHAVIGEFYIAQEDYQRAISEFEQAVELFSSGLEKGRLQYYVGELYRQAGKLDTATRKYLKVIDYTSDYRLRFNALYKYAVLQREQTHYDASLAALRDLLDDDKNYEFFPLIRLEIANSLNARGDLDEAIAQYQDIDTTYRRTEVAARGYYALGCIWEKKGDYKRAGENYDNAKNEFSNSEITPSANERSEFMQNYLSLIRTLKDKDSVLYALLHPDSVWIVDSIKLASMRAADSSRQAKLSRGKDRVADSSKSVRKDTVRLQRDTVSIGAHADSASKLVKISDTSATAETSVMVKQKSVPSDSSVGASLDSLKAISRVLTSKDSTGFTRRDTLAEMKPGGVSKDTAASALADSLRKSGPPKKRVPGKIDSGAVARVRSSIGEAMYGLADLFYLKLEVPDSAIVRYSEVIDKYPQAEYIPTALYSLASLYRSHKPDSGQIADSLFRRLVDGYPKTVYAAQAREALGLPMTEESRDPAEGAYARGDSLLWMNNVTDAVAAFRDIVLRFPRSEYAAKAQYAIGWIYESIDGRLDSAASNYRRLLKDYPNSQYVALVKDKIAEVDGYLKEQESKKSEGQSKQPVQEQKKTDSQAKEQVEKAPLPDVQGGQLNRKGVVKDSTEDAEERALRRPKISPVQQDTAKAKLRGEGKD